MSEPKFTSGPWHAEKREYIHIHAPERTADCIPIATIEDGFVGYVEAEQQANAALISSAPELYAEIEYHLEMMRLLPGCEESDDFKRMEALLKKARGEL